MHGLDNIVGQVKQLALPVVLQLFLSLLGYSLVHLLLPSEHLDHTEHIHGLK